jgi:hypothetical protein
MLSCGCNRRSFAASTGALFVLFLSWATIIPVLASSKTNIVMRLHVKVVFAGIPPLFMRSKIWLEDTPTMKRMLTDAWIRGSQFDAAEGEDHPVLLNKFEVAVTFATPDQTAALDSTLEGAVMEAKSDPHAERPLGLSAERMAERFSAALEMQLTAEEAARRTTVFLVYNPVGLTGVTKYGYTAGVRSSTTDVDIFGFSRADRFVFIDIASRPFDTREFMLSHPGTVNDNLTTLARDVGGYGRQLGSVMRDTLTPLLSDASMQVFPAAKDIVFKLLMIDADASSRPVKEELDPRKPDREIGWTFDANRFRGLMESVLATTAMGGKTVFVELERSSDFTTTMAVSRAMSQSRHKIYVDTDSLVNDLVTRSSRCPIGVIGDIDGADYDPGTELPQKYSFYTDSSLIAHVPIILISFADRRHDISLMQAERIRAKAIGQQAVIIVENRMQSNGQDQQFDMTALAAKEALELLCGLDPKVLKQADMTQSTVPIILIDAAQRNIVQRQLIWSRRSAVEPAESALNFDGFDATLIPHGKDSPVDVSRRSTRELLLKTKESWQAAIEARDTGVELAAATRELSRSVTVLRDSLNAELCSLSLQKDLKLEAQTALQAGREPWGMWKLFISPFIAGLLTTAAKSFFSFIVASLRWRESARCRATDSMINGLGSRSRSLYRSTADGLWGEWLPPRAMSTRRRRDIH